MRTSIKGTLMGLFAAAILATPFAASASPSQPAGIPCDVSLGTLCGHVYHLNAGLSKPIPVRCNFGVPSSKQYVAKGHRDTCHDADQVYVWAHTELWCQFGTIGGFFMQKQFDAIGWHKINDNFNKRCDYHKD